MSYLLLSHRSYTGVRFKLVKSNSCSSRLELVGTGKINSLQQHQQMHQQISQNMKRDDDKRRSILHRLHQQTTVPNTTTSAPSTTIAAGETTSDAAKSRLKTAPNCSSVDAGKTNGTSAAAAAATEKCVKQIVERLETTRAAVPRQPNGAIPNGPRIIDSKCIEKTAGEDAVQKQARVKPPKQLVINPAAVVVTAEASRAQSPAVVTVNNSISVAGGGGEEKKEPATHPPKESIYATAKELLEQKQLLFQQKNAQQPGKTKVVRNRNVDLALSIVKTHNKASPGTVGGSDKEQEKSVFNETQPRDGTASPRPTTTTTTSTTEKRQPKPLLTTFSQQREMLSRHLQKDKERRMPMKNNGKGDNAKPNSNVVQRAHQQQQQKKQEKAVASLKEETNEEQQQQEHEQQDDSQDSQKMIKWGALNGPKFDEKFYVSNDTKLKQKKIYDEMEFEEFEVYDSLNSNK